MKKISLITVLFLIVSLAFANSYQIEFDGNEELIQIHENDFQKLSMDITFDGIQSFDVNSKKGTFNQIVIPNTYYVGEIGSPKLPALKKLIEIPFGADVSVNVLNYTTTEYKLSDFGIIYPIIPVQPSHSKSIEDLTLVDFEYNEAQYQIDRFSDFELANIEVLGVMRGVRLARLDVAPVNYNPVTGMIKVYNNIELEVNFTGSDSELSKHIKDSTFSPYFEAIYNKITNYRETREEYPAHPDLTKYPVKYLIVADRIFEDELADFITWKTKKGFNVVEAYTDVIGSSASAIQTYVHAQYNAGTPSDPAPSFVLFVGDTDRIPASTIGSESGKATDLDYCTVDGDYFPEMYYGRMSAATEAQLTYQIDKILYYERYEFADPSYLDDVTLIAGVDGAANPTHGQPTINYGTDYYFNILNGYTNINTYLTSYTGCYDADRIKVGFINYTAHCGETVWGDPTLTQSAVRAFTNTGKYPLAIGNCCLAADFGYAECIGETWMRKENAGAVGYIGSSPNSLWDEDVYWSVGQFGYCGNGAQIIREHTTLGAYDAPSMSDYIAQDALVFVGDLAVTESGSSYTEYYWQGYNTLGDPSLVIYNTQGETNTVNFAGMLPILATTFTVEAEEGSYVAISYDDGSGRVLHGSALVDATGSVEVDIIPFTSACTADIVVTKPQYQPEILTVPVAPLAGAYVSIESYTVSAGGDAVINGGETVLLTVTLENIGTETAENVEMNISITDPYVTISDSYHSFGAIAAGAQVTGTSAYSFDVATNIPDGYNFQIAGAITCTVDNWDQNMNFTASNPPEISVNPTSFSETLAPGANTTGNLRITNNGYTNLDYNLSIVDPARGSGGPDAENYSWIDSNEPGGPTYNWVDISTLGISITLSDDDNDGPHALGFNFEYYGNTFNSVNIGSNGFASFSSTSTAYSNGSIPDSAEPNNLLALFWDDLNPSTGGNVYYYQDTNRFIIEYNNVPRYTSGTGNITAQIIINQDGTIIYQYAAIPTELTSCTIGIENSDGSIGLEVVQDAAYLEANMAILFSQAPDWLTASTYSGTIVGETYEDVTLTFEAAELEVGVYTKNVIITHNDTSTLPVTIPVTLTVSESGNPEIVVLPSALAFGDVFVGSSSTMQFTIQNTGTATLSGSISTPAGYTVSDATRGESNKRFKQDKENADSRNTLPYSVSPGQTDTFDLLFEPTAEQLYSGNVIITHNAAGGDELVSVIGTGIPAPEADITTSSVSYSKTLAPDASTSDNLTIGNTGDAALDYTATVSYVTTREEGTITDATRAYCASTYSNSGAGADDWIANVSFNTINNTTSFDDPDSYGNYTTISTDIEQDSTYPLCVSLGFENDYFYTQHVRIWIDWDQSESFDADESFYLGTAPDDGTYQICGDILVPSDAELGNTGMRIIEQYSSDPGADGACDPHSSTFGETEDYTVNITSSGPSYNWLTLNGGSQVTDTIVVGGQNDVISVGFDATGLAIGVYEANITVNSNDPDESSIIIPVTLEISDLQNYPDWEVVTYPNNSATLYGTVSILGYDAEVGDLVGAFVGGECRGIGEIAIARTAYITLLINVAANGEMADFQVYDLSADTVYVANYNTEINIGETIGSYPDDLQPITVLGTLDIPENVTISTTPNGADVDVQISWTAVPGATSYTVYRSSDPNAVFPGGWTAVTGITGTTWDYTTVKDKRFYKVAANN